MSKEYKYSLQRGSQKYICPECGKKTFVRYTNNVTGEFLPFQFGRCDREIKCGYHNKPAFEREYNTYNKYVYKPKPKPQHLAPIPFEVLSRVLNKYENNIFIQNLLERVPFPFEPCDIEAVISLYYLGTVADWGGAVAFPFIDIENNIRAIQVKQFNEANHTTKTSFLPSILKYRYNQRGEPLPDWLPAYELNELKVSCLFGEHLLNKYPYNPIALVEAPKSAIYGALYFGLPSVPERFLWLAVYNLSSLNVQKCKSLAGRDVVLFPDLSQDGKAFELWGTKAKELNANIKGARFRISDLLEMTASEAERVKGCDIADYLISKDWRLFRESEKSEKSEAQTKDIFCPPQNSIEPLQTEILQPSEKGEAQMKDFFNDFLDFSDIEILEPEVYTPTVKFLPFVPKLKENWSPEISQLEDYFAAVELPAEPIRLNNFTKIIDVRLFIESHLSTLKANNGTNIFKPHLIRLQELRKVLEAG